MNTTYDIRRLLEKIKYSTNYEIETALLIKEFFDDDYVSDIDIMKVYDFVTSQKKIINNFVEKKLITFNSEKKKIKKKNLKNL